MIDLEQAFEKHEDEFLHFERVESPRHVRPDLCAFLMLHDLAPRVPRTGETFARDMVACAEHDEIWLDTDVALLAVTATENDILTLIRCGVRFDASMDGLAMFV